MCEGCYECHQPIYSYPAPVPVVPAAGHPYCPACLPVHTIPAGCLHCAAAASMTMSHPPTYHHHNHHHPPPPTAVHHHPSHHPTVLTRPSTLPGLLSHDGGSRDTSPAFRPVPSQTTPVHMHPDPSTGLLTFLLFWFFTLFLVFYSVFCSCFFISIHHREVKSRYTTKKYAVFTIRMGT